MVIIWLMMANHNLAGGFNSFKHLDKYEFVRWDDEIPNIWKIIKKVPHHQPVIHIFGDRILEMLWLFHGKFHGMNESNV